MYLHHHYISLNVGDLDPSLLELMIPSENLLQKSNNHSNRNLIYKTFHLYNLHSPNVIEIQKDMNIKL